MAKGKWEICGYGRLNVKIETSQKWIYYSLEYNESIILPLDFFLTLLTFISFYM